MMHFVIRWRVPCKAATAEGLPFLNIFNYINNSNNNDDDDDDNNINNNNNNNNNNNILLLLHLKTCSISLLW